MIEVSGEAAQELIQSQIDAHRGGIARALALLEPNSAFFAWFDTLRAVEEFINLPTFAVDDTSLEQRILALRLDPLDLLALSAVVRDLRSTFSEGVANRFRLTVLQAAAIGTAFLQHGMLEPRRACGPSPTPSAIFNPGGAIWQPCYTLCPRLVRGTGKWLASIRSTSCCRRLSIVA